MADPNITTLYNWLVNDIKLSMFQSNIEGELVEKIQASRNNQDGLIINALPNATCCL